MTTEDTDDRGTDLPVREDEQKTPEDRGDELPEEAAPEPEPEEEAESEPEAEEVEASPGKGAGVPLGRFQEINDERKALREEVAAIRAELAALKAPPPAPAAPAPETAPAEPAPFDFDAQGAAYTEALLDGEHERARAILHAIHQAQLREAQAVAAKAAQEAFAAAREEERVAAEASAAVRQYPFLADGGDAQAIAETREWWDFYKTRGEPAHLALRKAVERVGPLFAKQAEPEPAPEPVAEPPKPPDRAQEAKLRGAEAANRQPPRLRAGTGSRGLSVDQQISELSEEQFEKLSAEDKRRARGDYAA